MGRTKMSARLLSFVVLGIGALVTPAYADALYFDQGSSSTWIDDDSTQNWAIDTGGPYDATAWIDASDAHFEGAGGTVTVSGTIGSVNGIAFDVSGYTVTGGTLTLTGDAVVHSDISDWTTVESILAGTAGMTKTGSGDVVLRAVSTYTGNTSIQEGYLILGSGNDRLPVGTTVVLGNDTTSGVLSLGSGTTWREQTLSGLVTNGTGSENRVVGAGTATTYSTLTVDIAGTNVFDGILGGSSGTENQLNLTKTGEGTLTLTRGNTYVGATTISDGTLLIQGDGRIAGASDVIVAAGATFEIAATNWAISNDISGEGGLTKSGSAGDLRVTGTNTYTGPTLATGGNILRAGSSQAFGSNSALTVDSNASVELNGYSLAVGSLAGSGTIRNANAFYGGGSDNPTVLTVGGDNTSTAFSGVIEDGGAGVPLVLRKIGTGAFALTGANKYTGGTRVEEGRLLLGDGDNRLPIDAVVTLGNGATSGVLGIGGGDTSRSQELAGLLTSGSGTANRVVGGGSGTFSTLTLNVAGTTVFGGILGGPDGTENQLRLVKTGDGILTLTGVSTYVGATTVSGGTLRMENGGRIASGSGVTIGSGATFEVETTDWTFGGAVSGTGALTKLGDGILTLTGSLKGFTGNAQIENGVLRIQDAGGYGLAGSINIASDAELQLGPTSGVNVSGSITGSGPLHVLTGGFYRLSGNNSFTGDILLDGRIRVGSATALGNVNNAVTMGSGGYLDLYGWNTEIGSLAGGGTVRNESDGGAGSANPVVLTTGGNNASTTFTGIVQDGAGGRSVGLTKSGTGMFTLTGTSTYSGTTTVNSGTLQVEGSLSGTSGVTVEAGATLGGSGLIAATVSGSGLLSPGSSPGILAIDQLDPSGGLDVALEFTAAGSPDYGNASASINDVLRITDTTPFAQSLDAENTIDVYLDLTAPTAGDTFLGGFYTDTADDFLASMENASLSYWVAGDGQGTDRTFNGQDYYSLENYASWLSVDLATVAETADFGSGLIYGRIAQFTVVPEPATAILMLLGFLAFVPLRRRRSG